MAVSQYVMYLNTLLLKSGTQIKQATICLAIAGRTGHIQHTHVKQDLNVLRKKNPLASQQ